MVFLLGNNTIMIVYSFIMLPDRLCMSLILFVVGMSRFIYTKYIPIGMGMLDVFIIYYTFIATYDSFSRLL